MGERRRRAAASRAARMHGSAYRSSPIVGMKSTSMRSGGVPTNMCAFAVSTFLSLDVSERIVVTFTEDTLRSGRLAAKAVSSERMESIVTCHHRRSAPLATARHPPGAHRAPRAVSRAGRGLRRRRGWQLHPGARRHLRWALAQADREVEVVWRLPQQQVPHVATIDEQLSWQCLLLQIGEYEIEDELLVLRHALDDPRWEQRAVADALVAFTRTCAHRSRQDAHCGGDGAPPSEEAGQGRARRQGPRPCACAHYPAWQRRRRFGG